jgi:hypothetical protein
MKEEQETILEKDNKNKIGFFNWVFTRWSYWIISILISLSISIKNEGLEMFIGSLIGSFIGITLALISVFYFFYK